MNRSAVLSLLQHVMFGLITAVPVLLVFSRAGADVAVVLAGLLFLLHAYEARDWRWTHRADLRLLAALWVWMLLSSLFTEMPAVALIHGFIWVRFPLFYAVATCIWLDQPDRSNRWILRVGIILLAAVVIDTGWQYIHGVSLTGHAVVNERLTGPLRTPNIANVLVKLGFPVLGLWLYATMVKRKPMQTAAIALLAAVTAALVMVSGARSAVLLMFLAVLVSVIALAAVMPHWRKHLLVLVLGLAAITLLLVATQPVVQDRGEFFVEQMHSFASTAYGQLYHAAYALWKTHPLFGIGIGGFRWQCPFVVECLQDDICSNLHPHNLYLEWLVSTGLPGFLLWIAALWAIVRQLVRNLDFSAFRTIPSAVALGTAAMLLFPFIGTQSAFSNWPAILFWYSLALAVILPRIARP